MSVSAPQFLEAIERFDAAHREDPARSRLRRPGISDRTVIRNAHDRMARAGLRQMPPKRCSWPCAASTSAAGHIPRSEYPMTRPGYHQWRTALARFHAEQAAEILRSVGYDDPTVQRVQSLVRKERIKSDPDAQTLEDAAVPRLPGKRFRRVRRPTRARQR